MFKMAAGLLSNPWFTYTATALIGPPSSQWSQWCPFSTELVYPKKFYQEKDRGGVFTAPELVTHECDPFKNLRVSAEDHFPARYRERKAKNTNQVQKIQYRLAPP